MRLWLLFPLTCYSTAFVLGLVCVLAGNTAGFMEDYALVRVNVSSLGYDLVSNTFPTASQNSAPGALQGLVGDVTSGIEGILNNIGNDVANKLAADLGIQQWYSLHLMSACEGNFVPNATAAGSSLNVTDCTGGSIGHPPNITSILDHQLTIGPLSFNLASLGWPSELTDKIDKICHLALALAAIYITAVCLVGVGILLMAGLAAATSEPHRLAAIFSVLAGIGGALMFFVGSLVVTIGAKDVTDVINEVGVHVGLVATVGSGIITISWVAFALSLVAGLAGCADFGMDWRHRRWRRKA